MPKDRRRRVLAWTAAITLLLLAPLPTVLGFLGAGKLGSIPYDKIAHVVLFVPLGWAWLDALEARRSWARSAAVCVALVAFGGAVELLQEAIGWRHAEWSDLAADAVGVALAVLSPSWWPFSALPAARRRAAGD